MVTPLQARTGSMLDHWWVLVVRGILACIFGLLAITLPGITVVLLIGLFAAFALLDGVVSLVSAIRNRDVGWQLFGGLLSIALGVLTLLWPASAGLALVILIAAWAITRGVFDVAAAIGMRRELGSGYEWLLILSGIVSIAFGFFVAFWPILGALAVVGIIGGFSIFLGVTLIAAGFRERGLRQRLEAGIARAL
jgi:uncharacterized membrane protein HdeD (DUF308 family)